MTIGMIGTVLKNKHTGKTSVIVDEKYLHGVSESFGFHIGMGGRLTPVVYTLEDEDGYRDTLNAGFLYRNYEIIERKGERIGIYYVEGVGLVTGLAEAERITQSFTGKPPKFAYWENIGDEEE